MTTFTAFIGANVFYGARLRSLVLFLARTKLFRARWSEQVHDEWMRNLIQNRSDLELENLARTCAAMNAAVPYCIVDGYEPLIKSIELPDPDDRHVVAAAIMTRANVIVTFNERDFPAKILDGFRLHTKHPDEFLVDVFSLAPALFLGAVRDDFAHYGYPPLNYDDYLTGLKRAGLPGLAEELLAY